MSVLYGYCKQNVKLNNADGEVVPAASRLPDRVPLTGHNTASAVYKVIGKPVEPTACGSRNIRFQAAGDARTCMFGRCKHWFSNAIPRAAVRLITFAVFSANHPRCSTIRFSSVTARNTTIVRRPYTAATRSGVQKGAQTNVQS